MLNIVTEYLISFGVSTEIANPLSWIIIIVLIGIVASVLYFISKRILLTVIHLFVKKSRTNWDDVLADRNVFTRLSHLVPALVIYAMSPALPQIESLLQQLSLAYMMIVGLGVWSGFLSAVVDIYQTYEVSKERPIKGFIQVIKIISFVVVGIIIIASMINRSPWALISGLGALSAVLILVFKDSILGLVAGIQLSANDMIRRGDWIEMPKYGADGDVIDVTLNTVKIQNWDKTIVTIPAYSFISDSFKNWRGMSESNGRRIKRKIYIDMNTVKFCSDEMIKKFEKIKFLKEYVIKKNEELSKYNRDQNIDESVLVNGRRMTNVGTFRAYLVNYLRNHSKVEQNMTFLVRYLQPDEKGLPIEIYIFCNDQEWASYEDIQADILDHIIAVIPEFELRIFQNPSGNDFRKII